MKLPTSINSFLTSLNENITTYVHYTYVIASFRDTVRRRARGRSRNLRLCGVFVLLAAMQYMGWANEISNGCLPSVAALMDAESGILGRQFWSTFRGAAERSDETTLEGKLINRWNIHVDTWTARVYVVILKLGCPIKKPSFEDHHVESTQLYVVHPT